MEGQRSQVVGTHPRVGDVPDLVAYFRTEHIAFASDGNGFSFDAAEGALPSKSSDRALLALLEEQGQVALAVGCPRPDLVSRVRERVRLAIQEGAPQLTAVARSLGMSGRTLQRRLGDEATSFHAVVDEVRETLARLYMTDSKLMTADVAYLLGYSEIRAFDRAFRRWTGRSPSQFRSMGQTQVIQVLGAR